MAINIYDSRIFNTGNYRLVADSYELIIDSIAVMLGDYRNVLHWADYPMGRIDIKNGMCICVECHANEHVGESCEHLIRSKKKKVIRC